jgi:hypothetical protein
LLLTQSQDVHGSSQRGKQSIEISSENEANFFLQIIQKWLLQKKKKRIKIGSSQRQNQKRSIGIPQQVALISTDDDPAEKCPIFGKCFASIVTEIQLELDHF